jgi:hypothetical protein
LSRDSSSSFISRAPQSSARFGARIENFQGTNVGAELKEIEQLGWEIARSLVNVARRLA